MQHLGKTKVSLRDKNGLTHKNLKQLLVLYSLIVYLKLKT